MCSYLQTEESKICYFAVVARGTFGVSKVSNIVVVPLVMPSFPNITDVVDKSVLTHVNNMVGIICGVMTASTTAVSVTTVGIRRMRNRNNQQTPQPTTRRMRNRNNQQTPQPTTDIDSDTELQQ